jgi:phospholipase/carboxylesterase
MNRSITRRRFFGLGLTGAAAVLAGPDLAWPAADSGGPRLKARPGKFTQTTTQTVKPGIQPLGLAKGKDGAFSVPKDYDPAKPVPLVMMLHGARGRTEGFDTFLKLANDAGAAAVTPDARQQTWDFDLKGYGADLAFLDRVLEHVFARVNVDPRHVAIAGFSDGASYALSAGLANGDLFTHVLAFSPGFVVPVPRVGKPALWISHGTHDEVLSFENTRQKLVPQLEQWGYNVRFRQFEGKHEVTPELCKEAFGFLKA